MPTRRRTSGLISLVASMCVALAGCAHRTRIVTNPPGANVFIHDELVCMSPCVYSTPATRLEPHAPIRIERAGYQTVRSELKTGIQGGRIVAGIFTLGIVPLFRWPRTYQDTHTFELRPLTYQERLDELDARLRDGRITEQEYRLLRGNLLGQP